MKTEMLRNSSEVGESFHLLSYKLITISCGKLLLVRLKMEIDFWILDESMHSGIVWRINHDLFAVDEQA